MTKRFHGHRGVAPLWWSKYPARVFLARRGKRGDLTSDDEPATTSRGRCELIAKDQRMDEGALFGEERRRTVCGKD